MHGIKGIQSLISENLWREDTWIRTAYGQLNLESILKRWTSNSYDSILFLFFFISLMIGLYDQVVIVVASKLDTRSAMNLMLIHMLCIMGVSEWFWKKNTLGVLLKVAFTLFYMSLFVFWINIYFDVQLTLYASWEWLYRLLAISGVVLFCMVCFKCCTSKIIVTGNFIGLIIFQLFRQFLFETPSQELYLGTNFLLLLISLIIGIVIGFTTLGRWLSEK